MQLWSFAAWADEPRGALAVALCALAVLWPANARASNYLVIIADDLGVDKIGAYNEMFDDHTTDGDYDVTEAPHLPATPNIDTLAAGGRRFTKAWATPLCSPTRAAVNTGMYPFRTGIGWPLVGADPGLDPTNVVTLAEHMTAVGGGDLPTGLFGKWHLGHEGTDPAVNWSVAGVKASDTHPTRAGFNRFYGTLDGVITNYDAWTRVSDAVSMVPNATVAQETTWVTNSVVNQALSWIDARPNDWFAMVAFHIPHADADGNWDFEDVPLGCIPAGPLHDCVEAGQLGLVGACPDEELSVYQAMVECVDSKVGELLDGLELQDPAKLEDTVIVFMGDNGTPDDVAEPPFDTGRGKFTAYETGIRVPLIVADGGAWTGGGSNLVTATGDVTLATHVLDLYNTLIEHATGSELDDTDSESFADCFTAGGTSCGRPVHSASNYTETFQPAGSVRRAAVLFGDHKLVIQNLGNCLSEELYDLDADYFETTDLLPGNTFMRNILRDTFVSIGPTWAFDTMTGAMIDPFCVDPI